MTNVYNVLYRYFTFWCFNEIVTTMYHFLWGWKAVCCCDCCPFCLRIDYDYGYWYYLFDIRFVTDQYFDETFTCCIFASYNYKRHSIIYIKRIYLQKWPNWKYISIKVLVPAIYNCLIVLVIYNYMYVILYLLLR